jgi:hypothetical protein
MIPCTAAMVTGFCHRLKGDAEPKFVPQGSPLPWEAKPWLPSAISSFTPEVSPLRGGEGRHGEGKGLSMRRAGFHLDLYRNSGK